MELSYNEANKKNSVLGMYYLFWRCWTMRAHRPPNITGFAFALDYLPELDSKIIFMKMVHT